MLKKKRKGISIIEILIALTLLTAIAIFFSSIIVTNYTQLANSKKVTVNSFDAVKRIERKRVETKEAIVKGTAGPETGKITLFSGTDERNIAYYQIVEKVKNTKGEETDASSDKGQLVTYVADRTK